MFEPWVGDRFGKDNVVGGCRPLILGESHYSMNPAEVGTTPSGFTAGVIRSLAIEGRHGFFGNLQEITTGKPRRLQDAASKLGFWESVAFYNYVPVLVDGRPIASGGSRRRPTEAMFHAGAKPFQDILHQLEPQAVIVCGLTLWNFVARGLEGFEGPARDVIYYDDGRAIYARIQHPSWAGFTTDKWYSRIHQLIEQSVEPRQRGRKTIWTQS